MPPRLLLIFVALGLAASLATFLVSNDPTVSLAIFIGLLVLVVAFVSTAASLYLLVFSMLLSPEFLVGGLGSGAGAGRGLTLRFDDFLLVIIGFVWLAKGAFVKSERPFVRTPLNGPIMFYIAACLLATLAGMLIGRVRSMTGFLFVLKYYEYVFMYFMVVNVVTSQEQAKGLAKASLVVCFLISLFAISQIPGGERASAPFEGENGEPNTLGGYLVFMLSIATGLLMTAGSTTRRFPLIILLLAGLIGLMATLSRASFLAAGVVALAVAAVMTLRRPLLVPFVLLAILLSPLWAPQAVTERVLFTFTQEELTGQIRIGGVKIDTSTSDRIRSWQSSIAWWKQYPVLGTGVTGGPFMDAMYPRVLTETGTVGLVAFLVLLWALFRTGYMAYRQMSDPFWRGLALGFLLGYIGLLVHAVGANTFLIVRIMEPFWLFTALVMRGWLEVQATQAGQMAESAPLPAVAFGGRAGTRADRPPWTRPGLAGQRKL